MLICCTAFLLVAQGTLTDTLWTDSTEHYDITVSYPSVALENSTIGDKLEAYAGEQIMVFKQSLEEYMVDDPIPATWYLETNFTQQPSPDHMICIVAYTWQYSGGAHGNSWTYAFNYDTVSDSFLGPVELLGGQEEFENFAQRVMDELSDQLEDTEWLRRGASADPLNYSTITPVPDSLGDLAGYDVIFPPYQVACYACGPVEVYIPRE